MISKVCHHDAVHFLIPTVLLAFFHGRGSDATGQVRVNRAFDLKSTSVRLGAHDPSRNFAPIRRTEAEVCPWAKLRFLESPTLQSMEAFDECYVGKLFGNISHDWSLPGANLEAQAACWCDNNVSDVLVEHECCGHPDVNPWCDLQCDPDCHSGQGKTCLEDCPAMCFEADEYIIEAGLCKKCDWEQCFPYIRCITQNAEKQVEDGALARTCHDSDFNKAPELEQYWNCWEHAPKHSGYWNLLSSVVYCVCREDMVAVTQNLSCCDSALYGQGICGLTCLSESACASQKAQTCMHQCQDLCSAFITTPSSDCVNQCLSSKAPCRQYLSCRSAMAAGYQCDDGQWPESSSGCCIAESPKGPKRECPSLCEGQRRWRVDAGGSIPWWTRFSRKEGMVLQCSCKGCPATLADGVIKLRDSVGKALWDNGQLLLIDIARLHGLKFGPNRRMQEIVLLRNKEITALVQSGRFKSLHDARKEIAAINVRYNKYITEAAMKYGDDTRDDDTSISVENIVHIVALSFTVFLCACGMGCAIGWIRRTYHSKHAAEIPPEYGNAGQVVVGNPVSSSQDDDVQVAVGAPITLAAPMKPSRSNLSNDGEPTKAASSE